MDMSYALALLLVLGALAVVAAVVLVIVLVARGADRSSATSSGASLEDRLAEVDRLHEAGRVTDTERDEVRARLLGTL
ncbi:hypothetical protein Q6350_05425 [Isoptericola sp. b515]|uniref:hypothetical protein n=1 Tax=Isoptericola sp. b515 TaxID=3064652 RepID=UPI002712218C|nr:hypothetical protein [Isoptericola sp. b515]MDO8147868.1 hypothetical protein [Isoptericola sp. b515]